ncbi:MULTISPECIES: FKBP-type peptidyl-prolyl cis-trans isomerase [unclassified Salinivibrio]|uniref:FKBP-type peptidyl-prolyl cis-trans isomerase n=1 Tax=unclassified Salinivibrio TaxID=2636825 RepID=UPI000987878E|nr:MULTISPECIES: FKBP-type peptidyl-prolyl cis-trans isomerase [unclassified Salinivibrio]OOF14383.1 FKBP-type peptidyl-prolyl cis-trans isomerase FkpA [Salinivibrio sp. PR919]OOF17348.1 FKBP-type peptidyl-prolyl cis-trans isomerase FkpA [Salinivibrio sp. PR932]
MKSVMKMSLLAATVALAVGCQQDDTNVEQTNQAAEQAQAEASFANDDDKAAYAIGASLAQYLNANLEQQADIGLDLDKELVLQGVQDVFNGESKLTDEQAQAALQSLDQRVTELAQQQAKEKAEAALADGEKYRTEFASQEGVKETESGLLYKVDSLGDGKKPAAEDTVVVHYKGTLTDGTQFDSSYDRGEPATFPLNRVIPGWTEGVQLMPVGSKFTFVIPPELAYGDQDTASIPANSTLVFDVELLEIKDDANKEKASEG